MIQSFTEDKQDQLTQFVLGIQNGEFGLGFTKDEQPDLLRTRDYYQGGEFWIAEIDQEIVGCIGLQKLSDQEGILRKMFVKKELRGSDLKLAQRLFDQLIEKAQQLDFRTIFLDTPAIAKAAHRFYEKNGFKELDRTEIPAGYTFPDRDSKIFRLDLK